MAPLKAMYMYNGYSDEYRGYQNPMKIEILVFQVHDSSIFIFKEFRNSFQD